MGTNCLWVHMLRARVSAPVKVCIVRILVVEISLMLCVSCADRPKAETVVEGFFDEVNKSNFESAKTSYLSSALKAAIDTPSIMQHKSIRESFGQFAGHIKSSEIQSAQVNGEAASALIVISTTWGSRSQGRIALVKEEGRVWRISDWMTYLPLVVIIAFMTGVPQTFVA